MAKKRKLRPSEPETSKAPEPQPEQPQSTDPPHGDPQLQAEEEDPTQCVPIQEEEEPQQMVVDESKEDQEEQQEEEEEVDEELQEQVVEEEEEEDREHDEGQNETLNGDVSAEGVGNEGAENEANGGGNEIGLDDDDDEPLEKLLEPFSKEQLHSLVKQAADKYPDFIECVRDLADADPAHRKIFVHGLGWDTTAETLISEFSKYGEIEDCKAVTDRVSGKSKGYAFILFKRRIGAKRALKEPQKKIGSRTTSCQLASAGPVPAPPPVVSSVSEYTQRKIFVSNVSADVDPQKLLEYFKQFGDVEEGPLGLDRHTGKPKGFALFVYRSVESAKRALEEPHKNFEGLTLHCQKAIDGPKQSGKPFHQHQHQHQHHQTQHQHQHHPHHQQYYPRKEKNKYSTGGTGPGHLMAPSAPAPAVGFNPGVAGQQALNPALGQALSALLATQGGGLGIGNLLGGIGGPPVNQPGPPGGYANQAAGGYGNQQVMQGGYQNPQMGQGSGRPHPGPGAPYMGH
ncbi:hypothetical protein CsatB_028323 [Cannabis sativa]